MLGSVRHSKAVLCSGGSLGPHAEGRGPRCCRGLRTGLAAGGGRGVPPMVQTLTDRLTSCFLSLFQFRRAVISGFEFIH